MTTNPFKLGDDSHNRCTALTAFMLSSQLQICACDKSKAVIFSYDDDRKLVVSFPLSSIETLLFAGVVLPKSSIDPTNRDLDQILLLHHSGYGLVGLSMHDIIEQCSASISNSLELRLEEVNESLLRRNDQIHSSNAYHQNLHPFYLVKSNRVFYAAIAEDSLVVGEIEADYTPSPRSNHAAYAGDFSGLVRLPLSTFKIADRMKAVFDVNENKRNKGNGKNNLVNAYVNTNHEHVSAVDVAVAGKTLHFYVGTTKGRIFDVEFEGGNDAGRVSQIYSLPDNQKTPSRIISNLHAVNYMGRPALAFNRRQPMVENSCSEIMLKYLNADSFAAEDAGTRGAEKLYSDFTPLWFRFDGTRLYSLSGRRISVHNVLADATSQSRNFGLSYLTDKNEFSFELGSKDKFGKSIYPYLGLIMHTTNGGR